ncbi:MAG: maleylpyruvate isomerase family mycothiol-dependent enzyme [Actinobacteria bacterium]|nr:maleylpyruvate isomerase family mycothiol-dependent enzyme [Actinomycetota bacterium]
MQTADFMTALARDGAAFSAACEVAGMDAPVPSCPEWTVADLMWHLAEVHDFWTVVVRDRVEYPDAYVEPERPPAADLPAFYRDRLAGVVEVLSAADPAQQNWTWTADHSAGFVQRRMAHETAMHLTDAQAAAGLALSVEPELASDGIDEFLEYFRSRSTDAPAAGGSVHLHCTDVAGEWTVREVDGERLVTREHAKGDCALRGPASDLLLVLWRRVPLSAADVVGDAEVAARFVAYANLD